VLRIYGTMINALRMLRPVIEQVERKDRDLGNQLRRCSASVAQNLAEGSGSRGGNRNSRYRSALGSVKETAACLDVAPALGYVEVVDGKVSDALEEVRRVLVVVTV
jgi:four helix bundle protein